MNPADDAPVVAAMQRAMSLHQQGRLDEAAAGYRWTLEAQPQNATALGLLGIISLQQNAPRAALDLFGRALALEPQNPMLYVNQGSAYSMLDQHEAAIASYDRAISIDPDSNASPYYNRAISQERLGRFESAVASYDEAIALESDLDANAYYGRATALLELDDAAAAIASFDQAIALNTGFSAEAHCGRAKALGKLKQWGQAIADCERAVALKPGYTDASFHGGLFRAEMRQWEEALDAFERVIALDPTHAVAHQKRGAVLCELRRPEAALAAFDRAIALNPDYAQAHLSRGALLADRDQEAALESLYQALSCDPRSFKAYEKLGILLDTLGRIDEAAAVYRRWLDVDPGNPIAAHMYPATSGENAPERCASQYVTAVFDAFADSFDATLAGLGYAAPQLLSAALARRVTMGRGDLDVLDAGCGTGLCGPLLRSSAKALVGVDLSAEMLAKAREKHVYDELAQADLGVFMAARPQGFDLVTCADTLIYIGALAGIIAAARRSLRPGGVLALTIESLPAGALNPFELTVTGRYAHSETYLWEIMEKAGFMRVECLSIELRREKGVGVPGALFLGSVDA